MVVFPWSATVVVVVLAVSTAMTVAKKCERASFRVDKVVVVVALVAVPMAPLAVSTVSTVGKRCAEVSFRVDVAVSVVVVVVGALAVSIAPTVEKRRTQLPNRTPPTWTATGCWSF